MARPYQQSGHNYAQIDARDTTAIHAGDYYNTRQIFWMDNRLPDLETLKRQLTQSRERVKELQEQISTLEIIIAALENRPDPDRSQPRISGSVSINALQPQVSNEENHQSQPSNSRQPHEDTASDAGSIIAPKPLTYESRYRERKDDGLANIMTQSDAFHSNIEVECLRYTNPAPPTYPIYGDRPASPAFPGSSFEIQTMKVYLTKAAAHADIRGGILCTFRFDPPCLIKSITYDYGFLYPTVKTIRPSRNGEFMFSIPAGGGITLDFTLKSGFYWEDSRERRLSLKRNFHPEIYLGAREQILWLLNYVREQ